jgi:hypothetical protein
VPALLEADGRSEKGAAPKTENAMRMTMSKTRLQNSRSCIDRKLSTLQHDDDRAMAAEKKENITRHPWRRKRRRAIEAPIEERRLS